jgi:hypothetical protein
MERLKLLSDHVRAIRWIQETYTTSRRYAHLLRETDTSSTLFISGFTSQWQDITGITDKEMVDSGLLKSAFLFTTLWRLYDDYIDEQHQNGKIVSKEDTFHCEVGSRNAEAVEASLFSTIQQSSLSTDRKSSAIRTIQSFKESAFENHRQLIMVAGKPTDFENILQLKYGIIGLLGLTYARIYNTFFGIEGLKATGMEVAFRTAGIAGQFFDDLMDWYKDEGLRYNLFTSVLHEFPEEEHALQAAIREKSIFNRYRTAQQYAPHTLYKYNNLFDTEMANIPQIPAFTQFRRYVNNMYYRVMPFWSDITSHENFTKRVMQFKTFFSA